MNITTYSFSPLKDEVITVYYQQLTEMDDTNYRASEAKDFS
jgi:hypothetical protein